MRNVLGAVFTLALFSAGLSAPPAHAGGETLTEPSSKKTFAAEQTVWGKRWVAIGTGLREKYGFDVYAIAYYVEQERGAPALQAWLDGAGKSYNSGGKVDIAKAKGADALGKLFQECACGRGVEIKFVRSVAGPDIVKSTIEALEKRLGPLDTPELKDDIQQLQDFLNYDISAGGQLKFYISAGNSLSATGPGGALKLKNPTLAKALLGNWAGPKPVQEDMRQGLLSNVNALLAP